MSSFRKPLPFVMLVLLVLLAIAFARSGNTQALKNQQKDESQELVTAVRRGGLKEAARLKKNYVGTERTSGWAKLDLENLVRNSSTIIVGTPLISASKLSDSGEQVLTDHNVRVEQTLRGDLKPNQVITLTVVGGKVTFEDGSTAEIRTPDLSAIETGKTYVLFLRKRQNAAPDSFNLTGGGQGLFEITSDSTIEPRGDKVDPVRKYKHAPVTAFVEEIKANVKKHPDNSQCCN